MTVVNFNNISGINSITAESNTLNFYDSAGNNLPISAGTLNVGTGASISSPANNVLALGTNNTEAIRIASTGAVGVGTNDPGSTKMMVYGNGNVLRLGDFTNTHDLRFTGPNNWDLQLDTTNDKFNIRRNSSTFSTIDSNGNLGIGSASPFAKLDIVGGGTAQLQVTGTEADVWLKSTGPGNTVWRILGSITNNTHRFRIYDQTNNVERFGIDSSGRVTMPYQPAFQTVGTNYSQSGAAYSIIIPNVVSYNQGSHYNGSTGRFTAPIAGRYLFGFWGLSYPHNTEVNQIRGFVNGSGSGQDVQFGGAAHLHILASGSILLNLNANDIFDFRYYQASGSAKAYSSQWNMWGYLIG